MLFLFPSKHALQSRGNVTATSMQRFLFKVIFHPGLFWLVKVFPIETEEVKQ